MVALKITCTKMIGVLSLNIKKNEDKLGNEVLNQLNDD